MRIIITLLVTILGSTTVMANDANYSKDMDKIKNLDPIQYKVTQENGTERAFHNKYWDNHEEGIYVDIVSGAPLFSSTDKFDSGSGWPSFSRPIDESLVKTKEDRTYGMFRTEVRSTHADSHLGHIFTDGPAETGGLRFCINSASMNFIPKAEMKDKGYEKYLELFDE